MGDQCRGRLVIQDGGFEGMEYEVIEAETLVGRSPTTDITLLDESISREHALVLYDHETRTFSVEDLQSTNGTKVNGKRQRLAPLADGDTIQVGNTCFLFHLDEVEEA